MTKHVKKKWQRAGRRWIIQLTAFGLNLFLGRQDDNVGRFLFAEPQFTLGLPNGSWRKSLLLAVLVLILLCSAGAFYARCWLPLALLCRDKFAPLEENGNYHRVTYFFTSLITGLTAGLILHSSVRTLLHRLPRTSAKLEENKITIIKSELSVSLF